MATPIQYKREWVKGACKNHIYKDVSREISSFSKLALNFPDFASKFSSYPDLLQTFENEMDEFFSINSEYKLLNCGIIVKKSNNLPIYLLDRLDYFLLSVPSLLNLFFTNPSMYTMISSDMRSNLEIDLADKKYTISEAAVMNLSSIDSTQKIEFIEVLNREAPKSVQNYRGGYKFLLEQDPNSAYVKNLCHSATASIIASNVKYLPISESLELLEKLL